MARAAAARPTARWRGAASGGLALGRALWGLLGSARFALVLIALLALAGLLGTVLPQVPAAVRGNAAAVDVWLNFQEGKFGVFTQPMHRLGLFDVFHSRWFAVLLTLLSVSVGVYVAGRLRDTWRDITRPAERVPEAYFERARRRASFAAPPRVEALVEALRRRRYRVKSSGEDEASYLFADRYSWAQLGTVLTHLALVLFLVGALYSRLGGFEANRVIAEGTAAPVFDSLSRADQMQVSVEDAVARFDELGNPLDYRTELVIYQGGQEVARGVTTVNDPFQYGGYRFHQAAYFGDGAALRIREPISGRTLYNEVLSLGESTLAPRVEVRDAAGQLLLADYIVPTDFIEGASGTLVRLPDRQEAFWLGVRPDAAGQSWQMVVFEAKGSGQGTGVVSAPGEQVVVGDLAFKLESVAGLPSLRVDELPGFPGEARLIMSPDADGTPYLTVIGAADGRALTLRPGRPYDALGREYEFVGRRDFAGISVRRDPGTNFIWAATALLLVGLVVTFYVPRRRVWAKIAQGRVWFAGQAGPGTDFESEMRKVTAEAGSPDPAEAAGRREET